MATPCEQQPNILNINKTLERMELAHEEDRKERRESEKRLMDILEKLTDQAARLHHLEEHSENSYRETLVHVERIRTLELAQASFGPDVTKRLSENIREISEKTDAVVERMDCMLQFYRLTTGKYALWFYGALAAMTVIGFGTDVYDHADWVKAVWTFWKG